jgi:hypothetical protein
VWGPRRFQPPRLPDVAGPQSPSVADPAFEEAGHVPLIDGICSLSWQGRWLSVSYASAPDRENSRTGGFKTNDGVTMPHGCAG